MCYTANRFRICSVMVQVTDFESCGGFDIFIGKSPQEHLPIKMSLSENHIAM